MQDEDIDLKSKSQVKRELAELTRFAATLTEAGPSRLDGLGFPDTVMNAIAEGAKIKAHGGRKRQIKFIGKLLRSVDESILERARISLDSEGLEEKQRERRVTDLRDLLLGEGDPALGEVLRHYPRADRQQLRNLLRKARKEIAEQSNQGSARALLRELRRLDLEATDPASD